MSKHRAGKKKIDYASLSVELASNIGINDFFKHRVSTGGARDKLESEGKILGDYRMEYFEVNKNANTFNEAVVATKTAVHELALNRKAEYIVNFKGRDSEVRMLVGQHRNIATYSGDFLIPSS